MNEEEAKFKDSGSRKNTKLCQFCKYRISESAFSAHEEACKIYWKFTEKLDNGSGIRYTCKLCPDKNELYISLSLIYGHIWKTHPIMENVKLSESDKIVKNEYLESDAGSKFL